MSPPRQVAKWIRRSKDQQKKSSCERTPQRSEESQGKRFDWPTNCDWRRPEQKLKHIKCFLFVSFFIYIHLHTNIHTRIHIHSNTYEIQSKPHLILPNFFIRNTDKENKNKKQNQTKTVNKKKLLKIPSYFNTNQKLC